MRLSIKSKPSAKVMLQNRVTAFVRDEAGTMTIFAVMMLMMMLLVGGIAVDLMRNEMERTRVQGTMDRAVLAAADLDQQADPKAVVRDYLRKSQVGDCLTGEPIVVPSGRSRTVSATCQISMNTFFLRLIGINSLDAYANSSAIEGVGEVEVSLVLDISGSMDDPIPGTSQRKIDKLEEAADKFVRALIKPEYKDRISISLVPYSEHVNIGPDLYNTIQTNTYHGFSHCVEIPASEYSDAAWDNTLVYEQTQHFQWNPHYNSSGYLAPNITEPVCPQYNYERVIPLSQDLTELTTAISQLQPRAGTSIFLGLKWGMTLLDPSFRPNLQALPNGTIDAVFSDRPNVHATPNTPTSTLKYLVLMTDGENQSSNRLRDWAYDSPSEIAYWDTTNWWYFVGTVGGWRGDITNSYTFTKYNQTLGNQYMQSMCNEARRLGVTVFTIAMDAKPDGQTQMSQCATDPSFYYETSGAELTQIFEAIAKQITDLRLTQ